MSVEANSLSSSEVAELRKQAGDWLRRRREACGLSQTEFAALVGAEYYSFISQIENGRGRIPPHRYKAWAAALEMDPQEFVRNILEFYDPYVFDILFKDSK